MSNSSKICCDANLIVNWALAENVNSPAVPLNEWLRARATLIAPALFHFEITNVLYRAYRVNKAPLSRARATIRVALSLPIEVFDDDDLHLDAIAIADRFNLPATYDAHYLALAEREDAEFWTADRRLYNSVREQLPWVRYVDSASTA